jgi:hypothetical protein
MAQVREINNNLLVILWPNAKQILASTYTGARAYSGRTTQQQRVLVSQGPYLYLLVAP